MTVDLSIQGAERLAELGRRVRALGADRWIIDQAVKEIRSAVPAIRKEIKAHELEVLPKKNGLNKWVAKAPVRANVRHGEDTAGITIIQGRNSDKKRTDMKAIDAGGTRSPLFGDRKRWYYHKLPASAFSGGMSDEGVTEFRQAVVRAVDNTTAKYL